MEPKSGIKGLKFDYPIICLTWTDAESTYGWETHEEMDMELPIVTTMGFLIKETVDANGHGVYIVASTIGGGQSNSRMKVPKNMVIEERYIYKPKDSRETKKANKEAVEAITSLSTE